MSRKNPKGFIVHPFETGNNMYHASYAPNHNKTVRSFKTFKESKRYLAKKGVEYALYDSPSGARILQISVSNKGPRKPMRTKTTKKRTRKRKKRDIFDPLGFYR